MAKFDCSKCSSQSLEWREGIGKKTGKKWTAWYCPDCKLMHGMDGSPWGEKPKTSNGNQTTNSSGEISLSDIKKQLDRIEKLLLAKSGSQTETEQVPF